MASTRTDLKPKTIEPNVPLPMAVDNSNVVKDTVANQNGLGMSKTNNEPIDQTVTFSKGNVIVHKSGQDPEVKTQQQYNKNLAVEAGKASNPKYDVAPQDPLRQQAANAAGGIGLTPEQIAQAEAQGVNVPVDVGQAATAGTVKNLPNVIERGIMGAGVGALAVAPVSAALTATGVGAPGAAALEIAGATVGIISAVWGGVQSNIAKQQSGNIGASQDVLTSAKTNMKLLAGLASKDPQNAQKYVEAYNKQLANVYRARRSIFLETQGNLNKFTEDGTNILSDFDLFLAPSGLAEIRAQQLNLALTSGVVPDFTQEDLNTVLE